MRDVLGQYGFKPQEIQKIIHQLHDINNARFLNNSFEDKIKTFFEFFKKEGIQKESDIRKMLVTTPQLLTAKIETTDMNLSALSAYLGIDRKSLIQKSITSSKVFCLNINTIQKNAEQIINSLNITQQDYVKACLKEPSLLYKAPETIISNVENSARLLNMDKNMFIQASIKYPPLFYQSPETVKQKVQKSAELFGFSEQDILRMALEMPAIFVSNPETIYRKYKFLRRLYVKDIIRLEPTVPAGIETQDKFKEYVLNRPMVLCPSMEVLFFKAIEAKRRNAEFKKEAMHNPNEPLQKATMSLLALNNHKLCQYLEKIPETSKYYDYVTAFILKQSKKRG